ncbi:hypothetical protein Ndes2526B_g04367 [Nannochloris sp. 'desiccata']|nr:hypothetical protein KSW81_000872 [Chlorella desiccata (nom. nud.)]KAH7620452.1 hypothetical protein NADE_003074 [Chlorella desiccata (nom. nud.)]
MSRGGVGAALGAAGATAYLRPDLLVEWAQRAATSGAAIGKDTLSSKELDQLSKMVEQLTREVRNSSNTVTVVHSDSATSFRNTLAFYTAVAATAGALYLVVGRGWRLGDLGWVTQRAFRQGMTGLSAGIDSLSARLADVKTRLAARIAEVSRKQDEAATATAAMRAHLADVGADVETVRNQVGQLHSTILNMDVEISDIAVNQRHSLHGIYILCKAVSELSAGSSIASKTELLEYTKSPVWQRVRPQGLEGILQESASRGTTNQDNSIGIGIGMGGGGGSATGGVFQGDESWLRQRYMLGTMEGARGDIGNRAINSTDRTSRGMEQDSSAAFMKALPSRDPNRQYRGDNAGGSISKLSSGERGGSAGYSEIRRGAGSFERFGSAVAAGTASDLRREEDQLRNQRQGFGASSDW